MSSLHQLRSDNKIDNDGNNCEKLFPPSSRTSLKRRGKTRLNNSLTLQRNSSLCIIKYNLAIIVQTAIFIFFCEVLLRPCSSQLDIGMK